MNSDLINLAMNLNKQSKNIEGESFTVEDRDYFKKVYEYLKKNNQSTTRLEDRLKTLTLVKGKKVFYSFGSRYDETKNELTYTDEQDLYHETFHIATKGIIMPKKDQTIGTGLNEGITDMLAKRINPNANTYYKLERVVAEILEKAFGKEVFNPYFKGSGEEFINQFDSDLVMEMLMDLDYYSSIMSDFWDKSSNLDQGKALIELQKISPEIAQTFNDIMYDISELTIDKTPEEKEELVSFIEKKLSSEDLTQIVGLIELNSGKIDIEHIFGIEKEQKRY